MRSPSPLPAASYFVVIVLALLALGEAPRLHAASFACHAARTLREKTVCATPELSAVDSKLAAAYQAELRGLSPASAALVRSDQREWLRYIEKVCPPRVKSSPSVAACLTEHYNTRLQQLVQGTQRQDGMLFFSRTHFVFTPGPPATKGDVRSSVDPGFGYGEFEWPQIDNATPAERAWNDAVYQAAISSQAANPAGSSAATFDAAVDGTSFAYGSFHIAAANHHLVDIDFTVETYGWGAAHPLTAKSSFLWWLDKGRAVTVHDVFEPSSQWQTRLTVPTLASLQKEPGPAALFKGDELDKGIAEGVAQIANWSLSSQGLSITFGQYQVGPYVTGMPSAMLPWGELKPLLNADFHPDELPPELPDDN